MMCGKRRTRVAYRMAAVNPRPLIGHLCIGAHSRVDGSSSRLAVSFLGLELWPELYQGESYNPTRRTHLDS